MIYLSNIMHHLKAYGSTILLHIRMKHIFFITFSYRRNYTVWRKKTRRMNQLLKPYFSIYYKINPHYDIFFITQTITRLDIYSIKTINQFCPNFLLPDHCGDGLSMGSSKLQCFEYIVDCLLTPIVNFIADEKLDLSANGDGCTIRFQGPETSLQSSICAIHLNRTKQMFANHESG